MYVVPDLDEAAFTMLQAMIDPVCVSWLLPKHD